LLPNNPCGVQQTPRAAREGGIGGADIQKQEMREAVELPLTHRNPYQQVRDAKSSLVKCRLTWPKMQQHNTRARTGLKQLHSAS
jgi:hypothetical protein